MARVVILVPRRADGGHRDRLWQFARAILAKDFPEFAVFEGEHTGGPFNRSAALNAAAGEAGDWDVAVLFDADVVANRQAVLTAVDVAHATGRLVVSHNERVMLNRAGTEKVLSGYDGPWRVKQYVETIYTDSVSCAVAVPRSLWDAVGGFDEAFRNWGYEDSAFEIAASTLGGPTIRLASELFHLFHARPPGMAKDNPDRIANHARLERYRACAGDRDAIRALLDETTLDLPSTRIPRILHRTVPTETSDEVEGWWRDFRRLHPGWDLRTHRDPLNPAEWPLTSDLWPRCQNGAQLAGLIRLECLVTHGGIYADADFQPFRSLEPLLHLPAFAGWEDSTTVPDFLLGAEPNHPAFVEALAKARTAIEGGADAWGSGPGVTTEVLPGRSDVLLLPPGAFAPYHYLEKSKRADTTAESCPFAFGAHHWQHSWGTPQQKRGIEHRQRQ